ncbi:MAG TPA: NADP-dependent oxidoreductase [Anaerolineales bacterium]|nr:NADP-dependent oxidoreductase [Anaerolineales bacterium]
MQTFQLSQFGTAQQLQWVEMPTPTPAADEVVVTVKAVGINPVDNAIIGGMFKHPLPLVPGIEFSGIVSAVGSDVRDLSVGQGVFSYNGLFAQYGAFATSICVKASQVAAIPAQLDFLQAAAMPVGSLTFLQPAVRAGLASGQVVLIHAAAGGVGTLAVQIAKALGATVIGTASTRNLAYVRGLGADQVVDYTTTRFEDVVRDVDMAFVGARGDTLSRTYGVVKPGGALVSITEQIDPQKAQGINAIFNSVQPNGAQLAQVAQWVAEGKIRPYLDKVFPLDQAAQAFQYLNTQLQRGKVVLQVG